jgi:hypothetical protein
MNKQDLKSKIEKLEKGIASKVTPENLKASLKSQKEKFEKELADLEKKEKSDLSKKIKDLKASVKTKSTKSTTKSALSRDGARKAKKSGKRIAEDGSVYYEKRANRTDSQTSKKPYLEKGGETEPFSKTGKGEFVSTEDRLNSCSQELFNKNYADCSKEQRDEAFDLFLKKYAISHSSSRKMAKGGSVKRVPMIYEFKAILRDEDNKIKEKKEFKVKAIGRDGAYNKAYKKYPKPYFVELYNSYAEEKMAKGGDLYDDMDEDIEFANKKAKMIANSLKGMGYNIVDFTEADYDADANISLSETVNVDVHLDGELAIVVDEGDGKFLFMDCGKSYATVLEKLKKLEDKGLVKRNTMDNMENGGKTPRTIKLTLSDKDSYDYTYKKDGTTGTAGQITFGFGKEPFQYEVKKISKSLEPFKQDILDAFTIQGIKQHEYKGGFSEAIKHLDTKVVYEDNFAKGGSLSNEEYDKLNRDYNKFAALYEDAVGEEKKEYQKELERLSKEIHKSERGYKEGGYMADGGEVNPKYKNSILKMINYKIDNRIGDSMSKISYTEALNLKNKIQNDESIDKKEIEYIKEMESYLSSKRKLDKVADISYNESFDFVDNIVKMEKGGYMADGGMMAKGGMVSLSKYYKTLAKKDDLIGSRVYDKNNDEFVYIKNVDSGIFAGKNKNDDLGHNYSMSDLMIEKMADYGMMDKGGEVFTIGTNVYILEPSSMFKGKTGFISGEVGNKLLVTFIENGNERSIVVSRKGVEILDEPEYAKGGEVEKYKVQRTKSWDNRDLITVQEYFVDEKDYVNVFSFNDYYKSKAKKNGYDLSKDSEVIKFYEKKEKGYLEDGGMMGGKYAENFKSKYAEDFKRLRKQNPLTANRELPHFMMGKRELYVKDFILIDKNNFQFLVYNAKDDSLFEFINKDKFNKLIEQGKLVPKVMADGGMMADGGSVSQNIDVFGYQTMHFDMCPLAVEEFEKAVDQLSQTDSDAKKTALSRAAMYVDDVLGVEKKAKEDNIVSKNEFQYAVTQSLVASAYNYASGLEVNLTKFLPMHIFEIATKLVHTNQEARKDELTSYDMFVAKGVMGDAVFNNMTQEERRNLAMELKQKKSFEDGGSIEESNYRMVVSQAKAIKHHADELLNVLTPDVEVEAWVVGKIERASTDLSDITHYIDGLNGETEEFVVVSDTYFAEGGQLEKGVYYLGKPKKEGSVWAQKIVELDETGLSFATDYGRKLKDFPSKDYKKISEEELSEFIKNSPKHQNVSSDPSKFEHYAAGGMIVGRYYKDNQGEEYRYIGEDRDGQPLFSDGQKVAPKSLDDFEPNTKETKLFRFFENGGETNSFSNARLLGRESQDFEKEAREYAGADWDKMSKDEKEQIISDLEKNFDRSSHFADGGMMAKGGKIKAFDIFEGDLLVDTENGDEYRIKGVNKSDNIIAFMVIHKDKRKGNKGMTYIHNGNLSHINKRIADGDLIIDGTIKEDGGMMAQGGAITEIKTNSTWEALKDFTVEIGSTTQYSGKRLLVPKGTQLQWLDDSNSGNVWFKFEIDGKKYEGKIESGNIINVINSGKIGFVKDPKYGNVVYDKEYLKNRLKTFADGGMMAQGGELNLGIRKMAQEEGFTPKELGKEYELTMAQAVVEALTDANYHDAARKLVSLLEKNPKMAIKPNYPDPSDPKFNEKFEAINKEYDSKYWEADDKTRNFAIKVSQKSGWDGYAIAGAFEYLVRVDGGYHKLADNIEKAMQDDDKMAKGGKTKKDYKIGDKVIYAPNGKWFGAKNVLNFKKAEITKVEEISGTKIYTIVFKNKFGQVINELQTYNTKELELDPDLEYSKGGGIYSSDSLYYLQVLKDGEEVGREKFRAKSLKDAREIAEDDYEKNYQSKFGDHLSFIVSEAMTEGGETGNWKKNRTRKLKTKEEAENAIKLFSQNMGKVGRNYKVEKMDDGYVISYESNFTDGMAEGGMTEHGLRIGDKVTTDMFWDNQIVVENQKTHKRAQINLETGQRKDEMAKGGKVKLSNDGKLPNGKYEYVKGDEGMFQGNKVRVVKYSTSYGGMYEYNIIDENGKIKTHGATKADKFEKQFTYSPKMVKGGKVTFEDKVKAIKASLLKKKKVSPKVQKDYGKTYSPKEAEQSAKRIAGSMRKKEMK